MQMSCNTVHFTGQIGGREKQAVDFGNRWKESGSRRKSVQTFASLKATGGTFTSAGRNFLRLWEGAEGVRGVFEGIFRKKKPENGLFEYRGGMARRLQLT